MTNTNQLNREAISIKDIKKNRYCKRSPIDYDIIHACDQCKKELNRKCVREKDKSGNLTGRILCNTCYQKRYRTDNPDIIKRHNTLGSIQSNWKNGELDSYSEAGKGYIIEQFICKELGLENLNIKNNTFRSKYDTAHPKFGNIQIKGSSLKFFNNLRFWGTKFGYGEEFDTLAFICMDECVPWKNVKRSYIIPEIELYGLRSITIYDNNGGKSWNTGISKWKKFRVDEKPFNESYRNLTIEDCPALRKDKFGEWLRLMRI